MRLTPGAISGFGAWLTKCGAEILPPVGEWEIFRAIVNGVTLSAYARKTGFQNWPTPLQLLYTQYRLGQQQNLGPVAKPAKAMSANRRGRIVKIAERDGWACWYCAHPLQPLGYAYAEGRRAATLEEVCPRQIGGPTHIGNQVLACDQCNREAGNFSVAAKVKMRDVKLAVRNDGVPIVRAKAQISTGAPNANGTATEIAVPPQTQSAVDTKESITVSTTG